jgi:predicted O-linked N-acetylglucosamine transferase (SPINDLY family)
MSFQQAIAHYQSGRWPDAERLLEDVIRTEPNQFDALHILAIIAYQTNRHDRAAGFVSRAIAIDSNRGDVHNTVGLIEHARGNLAAAESAFRIAVQREPQTIAFQVNLANELHVGGKLDEAVEVFRYATTAFNPTTAQAWVGFGNSLRDRGELEQAIECYRRARELDPNFISGHKNLIYYLHFSPNADMPAIRREQDQWSRRFTDPLRVKIRPHGNDRDPDRRLKIGYVSPNFYEQAECYFVLPLLANHDRQQVEAHCYASGGPHDGLAGFHRKHAHVWHNVRAFSHDQLAEQIRADRIDILIDLNMHMANDRLAVFAQKPAPIQVAWLAYPGSTGLTTIDYRLTDRFIDPPDADQSWSAEEPFRLPDSWVVYDPIIDTPRVGPLPAATNGHVTFGSLNNICKINDRVLDRWSRVLDAVVDSRLILLCPEENARRRIRAHFESRSIAPQRIDFVLFTSRFEYLKHYQRIDIALDPFPYNGITTTCDAFWMGVPVLTCPGSTPPSRAGLSCVANAGYPEWGAVTSEDEYMQLVMEWSSDPPRLADIRTTLPDRARTSPLMDAPRFARNLESAYRQMWRRWCGL